MKKIVGCLLAAITIASVFFTLAVGTAAEFAAVSFTEVVRVYTGGTYPRLTLLENGTIECYYESGFRRTYDSGATYTSAGISTTINAAETASTKSGTAHNLSRANQHAIELSDGSMMMAYRSHTKGYSSGEFYTSIRVMTRGNYTGTYSNEFVVVDSVGSTGNGYWEPFLIQLDEKTVAMYYADDLTPYTIKGNASQQYIMLVLYDMETGKWGTPQIVINESLNMGREGMPMVARLTDGNYVMAVESHIFKQSNKQEFVTRLWFSKDGITWDKDVVVAAPAENRSGKSCAAPCVTVLPDGRIAVSYQDTYRGSRSIISNTASCNGTPCVILSNDVVTYANADKLVQTAIGISSSFTDITPSFAEHSSIKGQSFENEIYGTWNSTFYANGYLYLASNVGYNTSTTAHTSLGTYVYRAPVDVSKTPDAKAVEADYAVVEISTPAQLLHVMNDKTTWASSYLLENDIDLSAYSGYLTQSSIGFDKNNFFKGSFNGGKHAVKGVDIDNKTTGRSAGLFGYIKSGASISDLAVYGSVSSTVDNCGGIVGFAEDSKLIGLENHATVSGTKNVGGVVGRSLIGDVLGYIELCKNYGKVTATAENAGGIAGVFDTTKTSEVSTTYIMSCENFGNISCDTKNVGGIVGRLIHISEEPNDVEVKDCTNHGTVSAAGETESNAGGIAGAVVSAADSATPRAGNTLIDRCVNNGAVKGYVYIGGIVGAVNYECSIAGKPTTKGLVSIYGCVNSAQIGDADAVQYIGGIVGRILGNDTKRAEISTCKNTGNVIGGTSAYDMGGIVGVCRSIRIENCEVRASIISELATPEKVGGIAGRVESSDATTNAIESCYFHGSCSMNAIVGRSSGTDFWCCYYSSECGITDVNGEAVALASNKTDYSGFSFYSVWVDTPNGPKLVGDSKLICGDNNGDGKVNSLDAAILARFIAGWSGYADQLSYYTADTDRNGVIDSRDAANLARHIAGWSDYQVLPVQ